MLQVGFSKPKRRCPVLSWAIRLVEKTDYSHVFIRWKSDWLEREIVYEAAGAMVSFKEGKRFNKKSEIVHLYEIECSDASRKRVIQFAMDNSGAPYGVKQLLGLGWVRLMRAFNKDVRNPFSDGKATWVCSELVSEVLRELDYNIPIQSDNISPKDIFDILQNNYKNKITKLV